MAITTDNLAPGAVPEGYQQVLDWKITQSNKKLWLLNLLSIPWLVFCAAVFMGWKLAWYTILDFTLSNSGTALGSSSGPRDFVVTDWALAIVAGVVVMIVLHELVHGLTMRRYGAHPKYGVLWSGLMFYATAAGFAFRRNNYLAVALAPLVVLSLLIMVILAAPLSTGQATLLIICGAFNAAGAIGDLWIVRIVMRYPKEAFVIDERDGVRVFMPEKP
jgi:hypothetical protein